MTAVQEPAQIRRTFIKPLNATTVADALAAFGAPRAGIRVQILRPFAVSASNTYSAHAPAPLGPAYLAGMLEAAGYNVEVIDGHGEAVTRFRTTDCGRFLLHGLSQDEIVGRIAPDTAILGISLLFSQGWPLVRDLIGAIRARFPGLYIVCGGEHATALPEYLLEDCPAIDAIVMGEGELTFLELVHRVVTDTPLDGLGGVCFRGTDGRIVSGGLSRRVSDFQNLPRPAWHACRLDDYFGTREFRAGRGGSASLPLLATRGCPYQCTFCSNPLMWTTRYLMREPAAVVDEIESLVAKYGVSTVEFFDLTAIVKKEWTLAFTRELTRRKLDVSWELPSGTRSEALDEETLQALYESGCRLLTYAPESGSERTLNAIKKRVKLGTMVKSIVAAIRIGHFVKLNIVIGFPDETRADVYKTLFFIWKMAVRGVRDAVIAPFTPYPGSELFEELRQREEIVVDDDYFLDLTAQYDLTVFKAYCRRIPAWEIGLYRIVGHAVFYLLSYATHPGKVVSVLSGLIGGNVRPTNVLEQRLHEIWMRRRLVKQQSS